MVNKTFILITFLLSFASFGQINVHTDFPKDQNQARCIPYNLENLEILRKEKVNIKKITKNWIFFSASQNEINSMDSPSVAKQLYREFCPPSLLGDSARALHQVDSVHSGAGGLPASYTGAGVIIGYVDTGIDFNHPDFQNPDSTTRVLRYWDHSFNQGVNPYGYGTMWTENDINSGNCTSIDNGGHGTTVAGQGSGGGHLDGYNKGMAPDSKIIIVESNFSLPNWTLTVADACDYIFKVADSLNMPAVVNLSLGTYLGSHDGNDPASELIEALLDEKDGRIVIAATGNSGNRGKYHVQNPSISSDTSFTWMIPNPSSQFGANAMFFDLWTDVSDATFNIGIGADQISPSYNFRGRTSFYSATSLIGGAIEDTIWNNGNRIATIQLFGQQVNGAVNIQCIVHPDSISYRYRIETFGSGKYDLWSGAFINLSDFETNIPDISTFPPISNYVMPDSLQTIVSSWNCSEKVVSVANVKNLLSYIDGNQNVYNAPEQTPRGMLSPGSSKGPARNGTLKPDISGAGDISMGPAPLGFWGNVGSYFAMDSSRRYARNGGTSMAAPAIAGIAALYLEKCPKVNYQDFMNDLTSSATIETFMGTMPNYGYGNGTANAFDLLMTTNFDATVTGPGGICDSSVNLSLSSSTILDSAYWNTSQSSLTIQTDALGSYFAQVYSENGCKTESDTMTLVQLEIPTISNITESGNDLSVASSETNLQWTFNGSDISGETNNNYTVSMAGDYYCYAINSDGCIAYSDTISSSLSFSELDENHILVFPNPTANYFTVDSDYSIERIVVIDSRGKETLLPSNGNDFLVENLSSGTYILRIETKESQFLSRLTKP